MKKISLFTFCFFTFCFSYSNVSLPKLFTDHMVLQRGKQIPVWGWANVNEKITVQFNTQTKTTKAGKDGKWMLQLDAENAGGPFVLTITGKNSITINDVLVGEVWICSGQSNMEFTVRNSINAEQEIATANYPMIHHFLVAKDVSAKPLDDIKAGEWKVCSPETVGDFTAVGFYFARELYNQLRVPIGLIHTSWGGTHSETWTSREAFENSDEFKSMITGMPNLNLDSLSAEKNKAMMKKIQSLQPDFGKPVNEDEWKNNNYDDSKWPIMQLPSLWEQKGLDGVDGIIWFRKLIEVGAADAGKAAVLQLSMIDDNDITYVNGVKVGSTNAYNAQRKYTIPAGVIKAGRNIIAVRVEDTGGGGGIYGETSDMKITIENNVQSLAGDWLYQVASLQKANSSVGPNDYPTLLFNAMLKPLIPYAMQGVLWYQGESNAGRAYQYRKAFPLMISDWRKQWNAGNFPFYFVQLASFNSANGNSKDGSTWAELREAQTMTLSLPHTGMAVTTDIGTSNDIHPKNKQDVGKRLAAIALHDVYNKQIEYSGPMYQSMQVDGNKIIISFTHVGAGLVAKDKYGYIRGFEIAGADKQFHYAKAMIQGDKIVVFADEVNNPVTVHFGWTDDAGEDNLFNKDGFPASPFRTDNWKGITEENKFTIQ
ncbi:sialate O-acetylesterase [Panacibacter ginsenosidivorans]|uniref:Sialate O-acetylesterase n=1 Tax=Panacibacter ginsenosidivorans TaxID=1813871 RepID=A0A5B8V364_9BACT|nr:sialate O-acetylesterase [Panacibacter ginsenosidivorans]QEC65860.1 sialate O-acetylesterase [Panacibacter ginsenosidivorans]